MIKHDTVIIHCADTPTGMDIGADEIRKWHVRDNGWSDIGYHWVIRIDGEIEKGRQEGVSGAHAKGYNDAIGICLIGGKGGFNFTWYQLIALKKLLESIKDRYGDVEILGHRDVSSKPCPQFNVTQLVKGMFE